MSSPALKIWLQPMGLCLKLVTNSPAIVQIAQESFGGFGRPARRKADLTLYLLETPQTQVIAELERLLATYWPGRSAPDALLRILPPDRSQSASPVFRQSGLWAFQTLGNQAGLAVERAEGRGVGCFAPEIVENRPLFRWHFLELAFFAMLQYRGLMGVHGAAVVKNGRAALLRARSGGGKSTLAYAAARRGWQVLAEDVVWINVRRGQWWGMPWHIHLLPDARTLFPELAAYRPVLQTNGEWKLEVSLQDVWPGSTVTAAQPGPVILLERTTAPRSRLESPEPLQARQQWLAATAGTETEFPDYHQHVEQLLKNNVYRLYYGHDINAALTLIEARLEKDRL